MKVIYACIIFLLFLCGVALGIRVQETYTIDSMVDDGYCEISGNYYILKQVELEATIKIIEE